MRFLGLFVDALPKPYPQQEHEIEEGRENYHGWRVDPAPHACCRHDALLVPLPAFRIVL